MKTKIGMLTLDEEYYSGNDVYTDGEIEDVLLEIVENNGPEQYSRIIEEKNNWPILYHLSDKRGNIIEWLPIRKEDQVLEIGAGCGAITGTIAKKAAHVTSIELSKKRSLINAVRNKECSNVDILVGNFQDIEPHLKEKYDYITLIGVFEYSELYIESKNPFQDLLGIMKRHLKTNGKIVIAIENKLGLKYWAGCQEDHVDSYFIGLEGYENVKGVKTFSKKELEMIFDEAGFANYEFYYPYPDYKFPTAIYSDSYLPREGELNNNRRNFDKGRMVLFNESKVFDSIIREGLFDRFSNSFLVVLKEK